MHRPLVILFIALLTTSLVRADVKKIEPRLRRPVAIAASENYKWLYVANRNSGSISIVDTSAQSVSNEIDLKGHLSDLAMLDDSHLLALDKKNHQLIMLKGSDDQWKVASRLDIAHYPVRLKVDRAAKCCYITSSWSQRVTMVDLSEVDENQQPGLRIVMSLLLPFEPLEMCLARDGKNLIVAGAYKNSLAVIDTNGLKLIVTKKVSGHNIRGLAISGDGERVLLAQQELNPLGQSTRDDVHWGNMLTNLLVSLSLDDLIEVDADLLKHRIVTHLGEPENGAGDPGPINVTSTGMLLIVLSGVNEIAIQKHKDGFDFQRVSLGRRPIAVLSAPDGRLFVANQFSDSISLIDVSRVKQVDQIPLGPQRELSPEERGEMLFFDSRLSHDGWMSCHSCHTDGHSSDQLNDNLSDGSFGAPKRVLSLLGAGQSGPWAWDGNVKTLSQQVKNSIQKTMQGATPSAHQVEFLEAFMKSLSPPPAPSDFATTQNSATIERGRLLFKSLNCQRCHLPPTYTSPKTFDVGLKDEMGNTQFNPPSLLAVSRRSSFFHDGRSLELHDVFKTHKHQIDRVLTEPELDALLNFLRTL
ncbi:MAG: cytochrome c peroxidase [Gimesia sp.]|nr:cytochrome c peroxidase [Gimesia sp.]